MNDILDDANIRAQRDAEDSLSIISKQYEQVLYAAEVVNPEHDDREIKNVILTGMGGSSLAALLLKVVLDREMTIPFEIVRNYDLPAHATKNSLVIASSYSGNTEETLSALAQAVNIGAQLAIIASGGKLIEQANDKGIAHIVLPTGTQPRMAMLYNLKALVVLLELFGIIDGTHRVELESISGWLEEESRMWRPDVPVLENYAKQLAHESVGKIPMFYGGPLTAPLAYKWKISWNESAKNVAFWNEYPEFNHNEFIGWTSHPVEKPFAVFDLVSSFEHPRILQRFELSDKLLSGKRPHAQAISLRGDTILAQLIWGTILADFASVYTGILNGVDPTPVPLVEKLKQELNASDTPSV